MGFLWYNSVLHFAGHLAIIIVFTIVLIAILVGSLFTGLSSLVRGGSSDGQSLTAAGFGLGFMIVLVGFGYLERKWIWGCCDKSEEEPVEPEKTE